MDSKQRLSPYLLFYALIGTIAVTMRSIATFRSLSTYGYYGEELFFSSAYLVAGAVLILMTYALTHRRDEKKRASFGGPLTYAPAAPLAVSLLLLGFRFFLKKSESAVGSVLLYAIGALAVLGALYFLFAVLYEYKVCDLRGWFAMACTLFLILYAGYLYFDKSLAINAHTKLCDQVAFVFAAIFFLFETRISLGREHWHLYTAFGLAASLLCAYSSIPSLLVYLFEGRVISNSAEETFAVFFLFAYILCRTVLSMMLRADRPTELMAMLHEDARRLRAEVEEQDALPFEPQKKKPAAPEEAEETDEEVHPSEEEAEAEAEDENSIAQEEEALAHVQEDNNEENSGD